MATKFKNLQSLLDFFKDEETCKAYYEQQRWGGNVACPHCGSLKIYRTNRGFKCGEKLCAKKFSITVGTIFENSKISLRTWFAAMYLTTTSKKGVSSLQLAEQLGITQKTAWFVLSRIRTMLAEKDVDVLEGTVEADETYVGGKLKNKHASKKNQDKTKYGRFYNTGDKATVVGLLQRNGKVVTYVTPSAEAKNIAPIMVAHLAKDARLITDDHKSYKEVGKGYNHHMVKTTVGSYVTHGDVHTNNIEGYWSILKRGIYGIYHQTSKKHLQKYCDEFAFRYNTRQLTGVERFDEALIKVGSTRITYKTLIGK